MFLQSLVKLNTSIQSGILPSNLGKDQKKGLRCILVLSQAGISDFCCQVGITCQKTVGARHILPPSMLNPRGHRLPPPPLRLMPMLMYVSFSMLVAKVESILIYW